MDEPGSWRFILVIIAVGFIVLTTFFSAAHLALRDISWSKVEEALNKKKVSHRIQFLRKHYNQLIFGTATIRLLANLALLLCIVHHYFFSLETVETHAVWPLAKAFVFAAIILSLISVAIPHAWAKYAGTSVIVRSYYLFYFLRLGWPLMVVFNLFDPLIRRLAGVTEEKLNGGVEEKQEELLNVVEEVEKQGGVDEEEKEMIESVLEFRETTAGAIMTPRTDVVGIEAHTSLADAVTIILRAGHSRYPVYEESIDKIIGMLYAKDLLHDLKEPDGSKGIRHRLREPYFVPESKVLRNLLHDFQNQKVHSAVVLDEYGGTAGVVTIEDILEELVGEIVDEYESPQTEPLKKIDDHTYDLDARYHVDELNDELNLEIPEEDDYETIGGFAFAELGYIPQAGETFAYRNLRFTVIDAEQRKINRLRLVITETTDESDER